MKRKFFVSAMAAIAMFACEKKEECVPSVSDGDLSVLKVKMVSEQTKVTGLGGEEEKSISSYQILVYDMKSRTLEAYATPAAGSDEVSIQCRTGKKEVIVLANAPDAGNILSYDDFIKERSYLSDNNVGSLVMEGHASPELSISGETVSIDLKRMVSKIVLDEISVDFENGAYDSKDFILKEIYLTNVAGDMSYLAVDADPVKWYNKSVQTSDETVDAMVFESLDDFNMKGKKEYSEKHHFYCYPNPYVNDSFDSGEWSPRPTRLVVEAVLDGELCYYPVTLPELKRNTKYHVSLNIIRPGATSPEQNMDKYAASFEINVLEWQETDEVSETI